MPPRRSKRKATDAIDNAAANAEDNASSSTAAAAAVAAVASASTAGVSRYGLLYIMAHSIHVHSWTVMRRFAYILWDIGQGQKILE